MFKSLNKILSGLIAKERKPKKNGKVAGNQAAHGRKKIKNNKKEAAESFPVKDSRATERKRSGKKGTVKKGPGKGRHAGTKPLPDKKLETKPLSGKKPAMKSLSGQKLEMKPFPGKNTDGGNYVTRQVNQKGKQAAFSGTPAGNTKVAAGKFERKRSASAKDRKRKNKHGIPMLSRKDLTFGVDPGDAAPDQGAVASSAEKQRAPVKKSPKSNVPAKKDKNGFPILVGKEDLYGLFSGEKIDRELSDGKRLPAARGISAVASKDTGKSRTDKRDRHGLPFIEEGEDLFGLFDADRFDELNPPGTPEESGPVHEEENFERLLDESIGKKSYRTLLLEKDDNLGRKKPLTLAQKLKRYPDPQGQIDLHGFTAYQAEERTDAYIRSEISKGTKTVRIIVGKGLHSEGRAVLPDVVEDRIVLFKKKGQVLTFKWDNGTKSKSGAMIVYLA